MPDKILVTVSSKGIGREIAKVFYDNNWNVCITSRSNINLKDLTRGWSDNNCQLLDFKVDFTNSLEILELKKYLKHKWGNLDTLVVNVGSGKGEKRLTSKFVNNRINFQENFNSAFHTVSLLKELLLTSKNPTIIFIGSIAAIKNVNSPLSYAMAKKSIENFSKYTSIQLSTFGIRVNCLQLGHIFTESNAWVQKAKTDPIGLQNFVNKVTLTKKIIKPAEVADLVFFLINSSYFKNLNGSTITFDSGSTLIHG